MAIPEHIINVYQRPKQGAAFLKRYPVFNYQHTISSQGWFDTASCDLAVRSISEGQVVLNNYLGAYVAIYVDNPLQPIWEGLINRITFNAGNASYSTSLDEMANRVSVVYTGAANVTTETPVVNNTASQAIYGIKQDQMEFGVDPTAAAQQRTSLRDTILSQRAFPQQSITQAQGNTNLVHLELIGIYQTLTWEKFFQAATTTGSNQATTKINALLAALGNGSTFLNNADTSQVALNTITIPDQQRALSFWDIFLKIAETGDASNYWVTGVTPTNRNTGRRSLYYRLFNNSVGYTCRQADGLKPRNIYGKIIPPWNVTPDQVIRVEDALIGSNGSLQVDPTLTYIQTVQYDANSQVVQWAGADNTTARAAFMLTRAFKPVSKPFGASTRTVST